MWLESVRITSSAVLQSFILGAIGYFLLKKDILGPGGLGALSRLVIEITLPILIFCQMVRDFNFSIYPDWWIFPLLSIVITILGLLVGLLFSGFIQGKQKRWQFISLVTFQNSGYLPLVLVAAILPKEKLGPMFIYLFLFLLGFNLLMWSVGLYMLSMHQDKKFDWPSLFSPPVIATLFSLVIAFFGLNKFIPNTLMMPLRLIGDCTLPLAMFVVGGNLALVNLGLVDKKAVSLVVLSKLIILPLLGFAAIIKFKLPGLIGLLILIELAAPSATSLSVITAHYQKEDLLISQGIFFSHILSILTMPIFLSLYFSRVMIR